MATFPDDATYTFNSTQYSMADKRPDRNYTISKTLNSAIFSAQSGHESRRQITRRAKRTISLKYTNISGPYKEAIENFYNSRSGDYESFEFDLTYIGQSGTMIARFDGDLSITEVLTSLDTINDYYTVTFNLQETFS